MPLNSKISMYGFCMLFSTALVGMFAISMDYFVGYVNTVIAPCQHDSEWKDGRCVCDNSKGVFGGEFCGDCQCEHLGICRMSSEGVVNTRWSCRCPNHQKWVGTTCNDCYAQVKDERCHGKCLPNHYGSQCNTFCYIGKDVDQAAENCSTIRGSGGTCNTCNGHGSCSSTGNCDCDEGWFTGRDGQQCNMGCGEDCPEERGVCQAIGGQLQCVCYPGYFGQSCEQSCGSNNDKPCSGHGNCQVLDGLQCVCDAHHVGVNCSVKCPGRDIISSPCSDHGSCSLNNTEAVCTCDGNWKTYDCSCKDEYTCSGRGSCNEAYDGTNDICICDEHFDGNHCERCEKNWWGSDCNLYCDPYGTSSATGITCHGHGACELQVTASTEVIVCKCQSNYESAESCSKCEQDYYPKVGIPTLLESCSISCARENECNNKGSCSSEYDGTNFLCECDKNGVDGDFDTLDPSPEIGCSACKPNWFPKDLDNPAERCTRYCAADGLTTGTNNQIKFGNDFTLQDDTDAQKICMELDEGWGVDANCHVCSSNGKCDSEGGCTCSDGVTGSYCEIDCGHAGREACSGHGRCIRDDLELWFDPNSNNFRCECLPYDPYTSAARQRLVKNGFKVEPPPTSNYYGQHCDYHCPTYNSEICAGRGSCDVIVALSASGQEQKCTNDGDCTGATFGDKPDTELADTFCSVMSTPWDSLTPRFFEIGTDSPGYTQCTKAGASCIDTIYSVDWGNFCVQMLNGWYPNELNTRDCAFEPSYRKLTEEFFIGNYKNNQTWCANALEELTPKREQCTSTSYPGDGQNFIAATILCNALTLQSSCSNDKRCIYDQKLGYIFNTDETCANQSPENCVGQCELDSNGVCKTKTYCRAKTCEDAINQKSIETLCFDLDRPCPNTDQLCSEGLTNLRESANAMNLEVSAADLFFTCHMYQNSVNPLKIDQISNIAIDGEVSVMGRKVLVQEYRSAVLEGRTVNKSCALYDWENSSTFCNQHLAAVLSDQKWYQPEKANWYAPWRVKCGEYSTLWKTETAAQKHRALFKSMSAVDCTVMNAGATPAQPWTLDCLDATKTVSTYERSGTLFPKPSLQGCVLRENVVNARWGQTQWSQDEIEQTFQDTCQKFSESPVIPVLPAVPDYCAKFNPCGQNACTLCTDLSCVKCQHSSVRPVCNENGAVCKNGGICLSKGMPANTYKCQYTDIQTFEKEMKPIADYHQQYKDINWLGHCQHVQSKFLDLERQTAFDSNWQRSQAQRISSELVRFISATISTDKEVVFHQTQSDSILRVKCPGKVERFYTNATNIIPINGTCDLEAYGVYIVSSVTVGGVETLLRSTPFLVTGPELLSIQVSPAGLPDFLKFGYHPSEQTWGHANLVTFDKPSDLVATNSAAANTAGVQWKFSEEHENIRISGWLFLSTGTTGEMRLLSNEKALLQMKIDTEKLQIGNSVSTRLNEGKSWCQHSSPGWIPWYIEVRYNSETHNVTDGETHHHQQWEGTVSAGQCKLTTELNHLSVSHIRKTFGRIAHSFHQIAAVSQDECHQQCNAHANCLQWSWTEEDQHCYLYEKRCHEDEQCVHGTHTLHSSHSHHVDAFVIDTDSIGAVTWAHLRHDQVVTHNPIEFLEDGPDVTAVCNDLASSFILMPGYETRVCNGEKCPDVYTRNDMRKCGEYIQHKQPEMEEDCSNFAGLNWTAYCYYKKSFQKTEVMETENSYYFPILGTTTNMTSMDDLCRSSTNFTEEASTCPEIGLPWFSQCLGRWDVYEDFCDKTCLTSIEKQLSSESGNSLCEKRKEYLQLNISKNAIQDTTCSKNVEKLIVTDFCLLQNSYHKEDTLLIPDLYMSDCPTECTNMLTTIVNRSKWRSWCEELSTGEIEGTCSRTSCDCNVEDYVGVDGKFCELTCPSGTENGIEVACSGKNGNCFAADFTQISAEYNAQEAALQYRGTPISEKVLPLPTYEPIWLGGPTPSVPGLCQCVLGSGDSCSIPCDRCNNGTYGSNMNSQYGICDAYFGFCRTLPPFMRYNVKYTTNDGSILSYNTTHFEGNQWQYPERFVYASDSILFEEAVKDIYDYSGDSYNIQPEMGYFQPVGFGRTQDILTSLQIFQKICTESWVGVDPYVVGMDSQTPITNMGVKLTPNEETIISSYPIPPFPDKCTLIQMSSFLLCFADGHLHGMATEQMLVIESGHERLPKSGMTFAKASNTIIYAFGGNSKYDWSGDGFSYSNKVYKIEIQQQQWGKHMVVLADWYTVQTAGIVPPPQSWAPLSYSYNELYLLSTVNRVHTMFILELTIDQTLPKWSSHGTTIHNGELINMIALPEDTKTLYIYSKESNIEVEGFTKKNGFFSHVGPSGTQPEDISNMTNNIHGSGNKVDCSIQYSGPTAHLWNMALGGNVLAEFESEPIQVYVFLEEWLNLDTTSNSDIIHRFYNTIEWKIQQTLNVQAILDEVGIDSVLTQVERIYMQQARWKQSSILPMKIALYQQYQSTDVKDMQVVSAIGTPSSILNIIRQNDGSVFKNEMVTALPNGGPTLLYVAVEGELYKRDIVISGYFREFNSAQIQFPYKEQLKFKTGIIEIIIEDWNTNSLEVSLSTPTSTKEITWKHYDSILTFYMVIHIEEWMYHLKRDEAFQVEEEIHIGQQDWKALLNLVVSKHSAPTYRMKKQTADYLAYYGSHCSESADKTCPGTMPYTHQACSARGRCNAICNCECEVAPSVLQHNQVKDMNWKDSPYRGEGCEITCPGFDGYDLNSICTGHPQACQRDGTCACGPGRIGDACQFKCPFTIEDNKEVPCSNNGGCGTKAIEKNSSVFTRDVYNNRLTAINRQHYVDSLLQYYGGCESENYKQISGKFQEQLVQFFKSTNNIDKSYTFFETAVAECSQINLGLAPDLTIYETHLWLKNACLGITLQGNRFYPIQLREHTSLYPVGMTIVNEIFQCTYSDCVFVRHKDDKATLSNVEILVEPPKFQIHGTYRHGFSSGQIIYAINGMKITMTIEWTSTKLIIQLLEHFVYNEEFTIVESNGEYKYFSLILGNGNVKVKLYQAQYFQLNSDKLWLAPTYGTKYRLGEMEPGGFVFNPVSPDTQEEIPLLYLDGAEYACDIEEDCIGLVRWKTLYRKTFFSLYTLKSVVGLSKLYRMDTDNWDFFEKMSLFYKGKNSTDVSATCAVIKARQSKYPTVSFETTYDIPVSHVDISSAIDEESGAIEIGNGIWTNCWEKQRSNLTKVQCMAECKSQNWNGFAYSVNACLCYRIKSKDIELHQYYSDTTKTEFNPCDTKNRNNPQTVWQPEK